MSSGGSTAYLFIEDAIPFINVRDVAFILVKALTREFIPLVLTKKELISAVPEESALRSLNV